MLGHTHNTWNQWAGYPPSIGEEWRTGERERERESLLNISKLFSISLRLPHNFHVLYNGKNPWNSTTQTHLYPEHIIIIIIMSLSKQLILKLHVHVTKKLIQQTHEQANQLYTPIPRQENPVNFPLRWWLTKQTASHTLKLCTHCLH